MTQGPQNEPVLTLPNFSAITSGLQRSRSPRNRRRLGQRRVLIPIALILLVAAAAGVAFSLIRGRTSTVTYQYQSVIQNDFSLSVQATGPVQSAVYNLVFSGSGKISEIDVTVGQTVKKGQLLAKLDVTSLQDAVNAAQAGVFSAQTALTNAENNLAQTNAQSGTSVRTAQTALSNAMSSYMNTLTQSTASVDSAQGTLNDDMAALITAQIQAQDSINAAQTTLNNDQTSLNNTETTARAQLKLALTQEQQAIAACTPAPTATPTPTPTPTATCIELAQEQYRQTVAQINATVAAAKDKVASDQQQLASTQAQANATIQAAQNKITSDQQQLTSVQAQTTSSNSSAQDQINTAKNQLAAAQASASAAQTSGQGQANSAQAQVQTALVQLQTAQHNLANNILTAPHAGIVTIINGTVGGTPGTSTGSTSTSSGGNTFIQISDTSSLQVQASVNESDTEFLRVGEAAQFTVSTYSNRIFAATVSVISPVGQTVSNVVTYPVTLDVNMKGLQGAVLLPGMTASVTIVVLQRPNAVLIPVNAVNFARTALARVNGVPPLITASQASTVLGQARQMLRQFELENPAYVQDNPTATYVLEQSSTSQKTIVPVPIVIGLTDDTFYEVLSGLSAGQVIVVGAQTSS